MKPSHSPPLEHVARATAPEPREANVTMPIHKRVPMDALAAARETEDGPTHMRCRVHAPVWRWAARGSENSVPAPAERSEIGRQLGNVFLAAHMRLGMLAAMSAWGGLSRANAARRIDSN